MCCQIWAALRWLARCVHPEDAHPQWSRQALQAAWLQAVLIGMPGVIRKPAAERSVVSALLPLMLAVFVANVLFVLVFQAFMTALGWTR